MNPAHFVSASFIRLLWITLLILVLVWIIKFLGDFATSPEDNGDGSNDTGSLFNWHPLLMFLAFPVFMTEAMLTYTAWPISCLPMLWKKVIHATQQSMALVMIVFGLVAVFRSHTQKKPEPMEDLFSAHSYLGITTLVAFMTQYVGGFFLFVFKVFPEDQKNLLMPYHHYFGRVAYLTGLATILVGLQEKAVFMYDDNSYAPEDILLNVMFPLIIILAAVVGFHNTFLRSHEKPEETQEASASQPLVGEATA